MCHYTGVFIAFSLHSCEIGIIINICFGVSYSYFHLGLPGGSLPDTACVNTRHWQCQCRHKILSYWHMRCPVLLSILYQTKSPNTGHLATDPICTLPFASIVRIWAMVQSSSRSRVWMPHMHMRKSKRIRAMMILMIQPMLLSGTRQEE